MEMGKSSNSKTKGEEGILVPLISLIQLMLHMNRAPSKTKARV
jgi:hypothetical protein